ncbi:MAG: tryptophan-rich sensory protein [Balneolaceae bacterium]|nr:tryptophan-rich sensory protein [Balneolaceae bacterium]
MTTFKKFAGLAGWILVCALAGAIGAYFEPGIWYQEITKPFFTPPNWIFAVVWPILYLCMGIAAWLVWKELGFDKGRQPLKWFGVQLGLNAAWSWLFFGRHAIGTALGEIILLWVAILFTLLLFWQKNKIAGALLIPYLLWISFAVALNFSIWQLN